MRPSLAVLCLGSAFLAPAQDVDIAPVTMQHVMVPMRDGTKLSTYIYFPPAEGRWPVLYEQRYADLTGASSRKSAAALAMAGYVVANQNFRGTHLSEGVRRRSAHGRDERLQICLQVFPPQTCAPKLREARDRPRQLVGARHAGVADERRHDRNAVLQGS